jgi:hypothetical protein
MKRAIGVAALGGGLLAFSAGAASAQETAADASAQIGRSTSAQVRVCSDGRMLSRLLGSCSQGGSSGSVQASRGSDRSAGIQARARVPRLASADVSVGAGRDRLRTTASGHAAMTRRAEAGADAAADTSPRGRASATADLSRSGRLLAVDSLASLAGVGLLGSSPFTLAGDPAADSLLPSGSLTPVGPAPALDPLTSSAWALDSLTGSAPALDPLTGSEPAPALDLLTGSVPALDLLTGSALVPAGIGVLGSGPIGSGNQAGADVGDLSPTVPVSVCGNGVGVLGDASAGCGAGQQGATSGSTGTGSGASAGTGSSTGTSSGGSLLDGAASGNQVDAGIGSISPSVPVTVCGNGVGVLGDASAGCGASQQASSSGSGGTSGGSTGAGSTGSGNEAAVGVAGLSPSVPVTACGNGVGLFGDASASCGANQDTSTDGTTAPPPGTTGQTATTGTTGTTGQTGTIGTPGQTGTTGLTPGISGDPAGTIPAFAPLRPLVSAGRALAFTGTASDLLAMMAVALLAAGALFLRAARPAAVREGGDR